jgi:hypothetical protein
MTCPLCRAVSPPDWRWWCPDCQERADHIRTADGEFECKCRNGHEWRVPTNATLQGQAS